MVDALQVFLADCSNCGVSLDNQQRDRIQKYLAFLEKWRLRVSLSSVADTEELLRFHFLEAFWAAQEFLPASGGLADIGSGAGFPGMAIKLFRPSLDVVLIERNYRKSLFLSELGRRLSLEVTVHSGDAESFPGWGKIDVATIRALRPSAEMLSKLANSHTLLLAFQGKETGSYPGWFESKRARFPLSRNRSAVLLEPRVSRETIHSEPS